MVSVMRGAAVPEGRETVPQRDVGCLGVGRTLAMTEQEAQVLAKRLERIWGIVHVRKTGLARNERRGFYFVGTAAEFSFRADEEHTGSLSFALHGPIEIGHWGRLLFEEGNIRGPFIEESHQDQFATRWMDFFRRGCWLSGLPVEASPHEKAQWMQGFTREEMDVWNLKI